MHNFKVVTWSQVDKWARSFAVSMRAYNHSSVQGVKGTITEVYGVPRGGLPLAVILSHYLKVPLVQSFEPAPGKVVLWVDDIVDSGVTFKEAVSKAGGRPVLFASMYAKRSWLTSCELGTRANLLAAWPVDMDQWVLFPWEDPAVVHEDIKRYRDSRQV